MILRPYQQSAIDAIYDYLKHCNKNPCVVLPTGTGKSHVLGQIAADTVNRWGGRVIILAHVKELLEQNAEKIKQHAQNIDVGIYSAGLNRRDTEQSIIVAGIQSVYKRACDFDKFDLMVIDEAHLIPIDGDGMYRKFIADEKIKNPNVRIIGLTATPYRLRGGEICSDKNILNEICYEAGIKQMILDGYLSKIISRGSAYKPDFSGLHVRAGEFVSSEVDELMSDNSVAKNACVELLELTKNRKKILIFTSNVSHCEKIVTELTRRTDAGVAMITGKTPKHERAEIIDRFKNIKIKTSLFGDTKQLIKYLVNVNVLTTGFDATEIDCVVLLRPTASPGLYVQMVGRGTRIHPGKNDCLILDYGGNILRHGAIDALTINKYKSGSGGVAPIKECEKCHAIIFASYSKCPECGFEFTKNGTELDDTASDENILSDEITESVFEVVGVDYAVHTKHGADADAPKTLKIIYQNALLSVVTEWVCPEHTGWARQKFCSWWKKRSHAPIPDTAERAVFFAKRNAIAMPFEILIRNTSGDKFSRIVGYKLNEIPKYERQPGDDDEATEQELPNLETDWDDDAIPF